MSTSATPRADRDVQPAGKVGPAYCTGVGKAMLAFLPEPDAVAGASAADFHRFTPATLDAEALRAN
jgi:IclR family KDG regulon transcriptional repressor